MTLRLFFPVALIMVMLFQNCGSGASGNPYKITCEQPAGALPNQPGAVIFVNSTSEWENQYTAKINQNLNFGVGYPQYVDGNCTEPLLSNLTEENCGPAPTGSYWLLPDGTQVANYCVTKAFGAPGNYSMQWVYPDLNGSNSTFVEIEIVVQ